MKKKKEKKIPKKMKREMMTSLIQKKTIMHLKRKEKEQ
jgi:hypothetical protein